MLCCWQCAMAAGLELIRPWVVVMAMGMAMAMAMMGGRHVSVCMYVCMNECRQSIVAAADHRPWAGCSVALWPILRQWGCPLQRSHRRSLIYFCMGTTPTLSSTVCHCLSATGYTTCHSLPLRTGAPFISALGNGQSPNAANPSHTGPPVLAQELPGAR